MVKVIYEDKNLIAVNKEAGVLVHSVMGRGEEPTLTKELLKKYPEVKGVGDSPERPGIVHRLDKDTSGVLLIARNQKFFEYLKDLFQKHEVQKRYLALVCGKIAKKHGIIDKPISIKSGTVRRTVYEGRMTKKAVTEYKVLKIIKKDGQSFSLIRVMPKTGRTHQIRIHLASIGCPIVGDKLYGKKDNPWQLTRQFLHAESVEFSLKTGERIKIEADLPDELKKVILDVHE